MKVGIVHLTLRELGGAERVFALLVKALNELGITPEVITEGDAPPQLIMERFGIPVNYKTISIKSRVSKMKHFTLYKRLITAALGVRGLSKYDVIFNTTGGLTPTEIPDRSTYVLYVFNPLISADGHFINYRGDLRRYSHGFWYLYSLPFRVIASRFVRKAVRKAERICTVSRYIKHMVLGAWGNGNYVVAYPPIDEAFRQGWGNTRRDGVILIGRFVPEKRHLDLIKYAEEHREVRVRLVGSVPPQDPTYFNLVRREAEEKDLKNVELYPNLPFRKLLELLSESKVLIHAVRNEDLGLTPAEGVLGGALPLTHNSGGLREVVPIPTLRFSTTKEMFQLITVNERKPYQELLPTITKLRKYVQKTFTEQGFRKAMLPFY